MTRQELYDLIWSQPAKTIAPNFGISDVALSKLCEKHEIPQPPRGYWAKVAAGRAAAKFPLPPRGLGIPEVIDFRRDRWGYPVPRGTLVIRSGNSALVWVAGNAPEVSTKGDYYQGKKSIPRPLQLTRHAGSGPLEMTAHEALALTKMDWNNDALYDPVPVSIRYSQRLARTIANVPDLPRNAYPYRLFM